VTLGSDRSRDETVDPAETGTSARSAGLQSRPMEPVTVLVVDDHPLMRRGLATLLGLEDWVARVVEAGSVREGAASGAAEAVDVAVVDLGLPDGSGVELVTRLRRTPGCPVLVLTMTRDDASVRACLDAGATGYVLKDSPPDAVVRAARTVLDGGLVLGPGVAAPGTRGPAALPAPLDRLSPGDLRLLTLIAQGRTNGQLARELGVAEKTIRNRVAILLGVLGVADRVQAALLARDRGLLRDG
jgi:two-component system nitrate/nitrite response regulator NarL